MGVHRVRQLYRGLHLEPHKGNTTMRGSWPEWRWPAARGWRPGVVHRLYSYALLSPCITGGPPVTPSVR